MAGNPHLSRAQQNALAKADASVKAADTLKIFAYIFFVVVILIPGLFVSYYFNESDKGVESFSATRLAPCFVRENTSTCCQSLERIR